MKKVLSGVFVNLLRGIGHLPRPLLIGFSKFLYFVLYYISGYRKKVICTNLEKSFPQKSEKERKIIRKKYYQQMADLALESLFILQIKPEKVKDWIHIENSELFQKYVDQKKNIALLAGHYGNWEMFSLLVPRYDMQSIAIYKPVHNQHFEKLMKDIRERFGTQAVPMKQVFKYLIHYRKENIPTITLYITDQTPNFADIEYYTTFLNQKTPVFLGPEKIAKKWNHVVIYASMHKTGFAKYTIKFHLITDQAKKEVPYAITDRHTKVLEQDIIRNPEYWLWSHRRWKYVDFIPNSKK